MSLGHPRWQDGSKNGAKQIASRSHGVAGRESRQSERGPKVAVEGGGTASQGPRPTNLGWTEASAVRSYKRSFPRCSDSHLIVEERPPLTVELEESKLLSARVSAVRRSGIEVLGL